MLLHRLHNIGCHFHTARAPRTDTFSAVAFQRNLSDVPTADRIRKTVPRGRTGNSCRVGLPQRIARCLCNRRRYINKQLDAVSFRKSFSVSIGRHSPWRTRRLRQQNTTNVHVNTVGEPTHAPLPNTSSVNLPSPGFRLIVGGEEILNRSE